MLTLKEEDYNTALAALEHYYGITRDHLPASLLTVTCLPVKPTWEIEALKLSFCALAPGAEQNSQLFANLVILTNCILESPRLQGALFPRELFEKMKERDYLRLYEFVKSSRDHEEITLRNKSRSIRLANYSNWFVRELLQPFLNASLAKVNDPEEALAKLDAPKPAKKGRRANDPRIGILLWGTYQMITDELKLSSPMPNNLCNFLMTLLQTQKVLPTSPVIDAFWIRAQLRYIRSRPDKPRFPIED